MKKFCINARNKLYIKLLIDLVLLIIWIFLTAYSKSGKAFHEWLGLIVAGLILVHILLNVKWILQSTAKVFRSPFSMNQLKYIVDVLLLIITAVITVSGILIAKAIDFPFDVQRRADWVFIHDLFSYIGMILVSVHIGIHGKMILAAMGCAFRHERGGRRFRVFLRSVAAVIILWGIVAMFFYGFPFMDSASGGNGENGGRRRGQKTLESELAEDEEDHDHSTEDSPAFISAETAMLQIAPIMGFWILGTYYVICFIDQKKAAEKISG